MAPTDRVPPPVVSAAPAAESRISLRELAWVGGGFTAVTLLYMAPLLGVLTTGVPAYAGDVELNAWVLAWGAERLPHGFRGFWNAPIFYPYENALAYSENLLGIAVLVAPLQWLFGNPILTYNVAFLQSFVVAALGAYVLARELTGRRDAALVAACVFAFAPYRWAQLSHLPVLAVGWLPLALWALHRALRSPSWPMLAALAGAVLLQVFSSGYSAYQVVLAAVLVACWSAARYRVARATLWRIAVATLVVGALLRPAIMAYSHVWADRTVSQGETWFQSADVSSYLAVAPTLPHARWLPGIDQYEGRLFPGVAAIVLAVIALVPIARRRPVSEWRWLYASVALLAFVISLGLEPRAWERPLPIPSVFSWLVSTVPLFHALRVPARFGMLVVLAFAILAAMGAARILAGQGRRRGTVTIAVLCSIILWEGYGGPLAVRASIFPASGWEAVAHEWLARQPRGVLLDLPISTLDREHFGMHYQYAALIHRHRIVSGVSRVESPLQFFLGGSSSPLYDPTQLPEAAPFLRGLGVRYVLVRPRHFHEADVAERLVDAFERSEGVRSLARFGDILAYEIAPGPAPAIHAADLVRVPPAAFRLSASHQPERLPMAIDGDPHTRWMSGWPQDGTEWIALELDRPRDIARVDLMMSPRSIRDYPRKIEIAAGGSATGETAQTLYRGPILEALGLGWVRSPELPIVSIDLPRNRSARLVIRQLGTTGLWYWSIDELVVWERP